MAIEREKITFTSVFKKLFTNIEKIESNLPGYKEWEDKYQKQKGKENNDLSNRKGKSF